MGEKFAKSSTRVNKINDQCQDFNLPIYFDSELFIEKLMKMNKELQKKNRLDKKDTEKSTEQGNHYAFNCFFFFWFYIFFIFCN